MMICLTYYAWLTVYKNVVCGSEITYSTILDNRRCGNDIIDLQNSADIASEENFQKVIVLDNHSNVKNLNRLHHKTKRSVDQEDFMGTLVDSRDTSEPEYERYQFIVDNYSFKNIEDARRFYNYLQAYIPDINVMEINTIQNPSLQEKEVLANLRLLLSLRFEIDILKIKLVDIDKEIRLITNYFPNIERDNSGHLNRSLKNLKSKIDQYQLILKAKQKSYNELHKLFAKN
ncbi:hypothetical protein COBT_000913 [Conglomerata obtusa]